MVRELLLKWSKARGLKISEMKLIDQNVRAYQSQLSFNAISFFT